MSTEPAYSSTEGWSTGRLRSVTDETAPGAGPVPLGLPVPTVSLLLIALGRSTREAVELRLREHGIAYHHLSALGHLQRQPGLSYSELARRARVTVQSMQTTAAHLEAHGLVERGASTSQGRRADLHVTPRGLTVLAAAREVLRANDELLLADVPPTERALLERTLFQMMATRTPGAEPPGQAT